MMKLTINDVIEYDIEHDKLKEYQHAVQLLYMWKSWDHYILSRNTEILPWCRENCQGKFMPSKYHCRWKFEKIEDAILFKLRWDGNSY